MADTETFTRDISGRTITFHPPTDAQLLVVGRLIRSVEGLDPNGDEVQLKGNLMDLSKVLDILDSMVVKDTDRHWLEARMIAGDLDMEELFGAFRKDKEAMNRTAKRAAKKTTSRARPR